MEPGVPFLEKCNLLQACEWVRFKFPPMLPMYEEMIGRLISREDMKSLDGIYSDPYLSYYHANMCDAQIKIKIALCQELITVKGRADSGDLPNTNPLVTIKDISEDTELEYRLNSITTNTTEYNSLEFNFSELEKKIPADIPETRGRKTVLSEAQIQKLLQYAKKLRYPTQKQVIYDCQKWIKKSFDLEIPYETIRGYVKPVL